MDVPPVAAVPSVVHAKGLTDSLDRSRSATGKSRSKPSSAQSVSATNLISPASSKGRRIPPGPPGRKLYSDGEKVYYLDTFAVRHPKLAGLWPGWARAASLVAALLLVAGNWYVARAFRPAKEQPAASSKPNGRRGAATVSPLTPPKAQPPVSRRGEEIVFTFAPDVRLEPADLPKRNGSRATNPISPRR